MPKGTVNLAFVGTGGWAQGYHLPAVDHIRSHSKGRFEVNLKGICSLDHDQAEQVAEKYGFEKVYRNLGEIVSDENVNAIAVVVNPDAIKDVLEELAPKGAAIFSEKPPGISFEQAEYLADIVAAPNVVAFNRRFKPITGRFKKLLDETDGVCFVEGSMYRRVRDDKHFVIGTGIHLVNLMEYLFGPIERVQTSRFDNPANETFLWVVGLTFTSGLGGRLTIFPHSGLIAERVLAHSNDKLLQLDGLLNRVAVYTRKGRRMDETVIPDDDNCPKIIAEGYVSEYEEFFQIVCCGGRARSDFRSVVSSMRISESIEFGRDLP